MTVAGELPAQLDFFRYAQNTTERRKRSPENSHAKKRKVEDNEDEAFQDAQDLTQTTAHRVKTKGTNIPRCIASFEELRNYSIPAHLYPNLASSGYKSPTGIQSYCIPILLAVSYYNNVGVRTITVLGSRSRCNFPHWNRENLGISSSHFCEAYCSYGKFKL